MIQMNSKENFSTGTKREQFTGKGKSRLPLIIIVAAIAAVIVLGVVLLTEKKDDGVAAPAFGEPQASTRSYIGRIVSMSRVEAVVEGDRAVIPLELLETEDIVYFEIENNDGFAVPLMAYITPSGRIFTGSSMCEPCQGRFFSLAGETLVCDACRTTYTIENHEFIAGSAACGSYPPVYMKPTVENGMVGIAMDDILQWEIRAY